MEHDYYTEQEEPQYQSQTPPSQDHPTQEPRRPDRSYGMGSAALILGIISLVTVCCFYISIPLGALAILLALLSRGGQESFSNQAKSGLVLAIVGIIASLVLIIGAVATQVTYLRDGQFREQLKEYLRAYGFDDSDVDEIDDILDDYFGEPQEEHNSHDILPYEDYEEAPYFDYSPYYDYEAPSGNYPGDTI